MQILNYGTINISNQEHSPDKVSVSEEVKDAPSALPQPEELKQLPKPIVTEAQLDIALEELLKHEHGDGCFGCGYGGWWSPIQVANNKLRWRTMLQNVFNAALKAG